MTEPITPLPDPFPGNDPEQTRQSVEPLSITDKFVGIFSEPSTTYQNVRDTGPRTSDWLVPLLAFIVLIAGGTILRFANPEFLDQIKQQQVEAMQKRVDDGKMTQQQADQAMEQIDQFSGLQKILAPVGAAIGVFIVFFLIALIYWLLAWFVFKGDIKYAGMLAVVGLSMYIGLIDQLVGILLMYVTNNPLASLSPTLFMSSNLESAKSASFRLLANLNPITIWSYYVVGVGVHKVASMEKGKAFGLVFGLWIAWILLQTFLFPMIPGVG